MVPDSGFTELLRRARRSSSERRACPSRPRAAPPPGPPRLTSELRHPIGNSDPSRMHNNRRLTLFLLFVRVRGAALCKIVHRFRSCPCCYGVSGALRNGSCGTNPLLRGGPELCILVQVFRADSCGRFTSRRLLTGHGPLCRIMHRLRFFPCAETGRVPRAERTQISERTQFVERSRIFETKPDRWNEASFRKNAMLSSPTRGLVRVWFRAVVVADILRVSFEGEIPPCLGDTTLGLGWRLK
jgi:hypothetical protein